MVRWTRDELTKIAAAEELGFASTRPDDTLGSSVTIWVVRIDDDERRCEQHREVREER